MTRRRKKAENGAGTIERVAYHEAGHAVVAYRERVRFGEVTIVGTEEYKGRVHTPLTVGFFGRLEFGDLPRPLVEAHVLVCLAGAEAEKRLSGRYDHRGSEHDWDNAVELMTRHVGSEEELNAWLKLQSIRARQTVHRWWGDIEAVAKALLEQKTLRGRRAVRRAIDGAGK